MGISQTSIIFLIKKRKIRQLFSEAGATDASHAVSPESIGVSSKLAFYNLVKSGELVETRKGLYYLSR